MKASGEQVGTQVLDICPGLEDLVNPLVLGPWHHKRRCVHSATREQQESDQSRSLYGLGPE